MCCDIGFEQTASIRNLRRLGFAGHVFPVRGQAGWGRSVKKSATEEIDHVKAPFLWMPVDPLKLEVTKSYNTGRLRLVDSHAADLRKELQAERLVRNVRTKRLKWIPYYDRNEALDCSCYAVGIFGHVEYPGIADLPFEEKPLAGAQILRPRRRVGRVNI